jgi:Ca2+-binding EF-hand superfamily protein
MVEKESAMIDTVKSMPKKKKQELETVFNLFDKDGSGEVRWIYPMNAIS